MSTHKSDNRHPKISPKLAKIFLYPIKSLDPVVVNQATILKSGILKGDRSFAIIDKKGNFVNGKSHSKIHLLRSYFNSKTNTISFQIKGTEEKTTFHEELPIRGSVALLEAILTNLLTNTLNVFTVIVAGVREGVPDPYIWCTQLAKKCAKET